MARSKVFSWGDLLPLTLIYFILPLLTVIGADWDWTGTPNWLKPTFISLFVILDIVGFCGIIWLWIVKIRDSF
jgi:hypothetical protein